MSHPDKVSLCLLGTFWACIFYLCVILSAATVLDDTVKIGLMVFRVYITFLFCFLSNFYDIQVALRLFYEDEL